MSEFMPVRLADVRPLTGFRPRFQADSSHSLDMMQVTPADAPDTAHDPFEEGYRQGQLDAEQAFAGERAKLTALIASCEALQPEPSEALALHIAETVESLVRVIAGEVGIDSVLLAERARRAAAMVADVDGARTLHLHPEDIALLDTAELPLVVIADSSLSRGSVRVEDPVGWVEDGIAERLDLLREQLGLKEPAK